MTQPEGRLIMSAARRPTRLLNPVPISLVGVVIGWGAILLVWRGSPWGFVAAGLTTVLVFFALYRGHVIARRRRTVLEEAVSAADTRNRELDLLRSFAGAMLAVRTREELFREVASMARRLLAAEGAALLLLVEEGRFLRMVAGDGVMEPGVGRLIPVDGSLLGSVVATDRRVLENDLPGEQRLFRLGEVVPGLHTCLCCPLRSSGLALGVLAVFNRDGTAAFREEDVQVLQTLADQAAFGLDRVTVLEESRRNEETLAVRHREMERATRLKSIFLANMSHELRTPLNAIIGFSELLLTDEMGPLELQQKEFLESIARNGTHLLGLINNVLDLSKIEAGRMTQLLASVDLRGVVTSAVADTASLRSARRHRVTLDVDGAPPFIVADAQRIRQVLLNLLANASKFTPEDGEVTLRAVATRAPLPSPSDRSEDHGQRLITRDAVWVAVSDTGIGVRPEDLSRLFVAFSQVDSSASRRQQGTGLGLALCKQFVEMHGGTIGVESIPGQGSTFWFILPVEGPIRRRVEPASGSA